MDIKKILEKMDSMASAEQKSTGPKFPGKWKGTDSADKAKSKMVGASESVLPELSKTADDTAIIRRLEEKFEKFKLDELSPQTLKSYTKGAMRDTISNKKDRNPGMAKAFSRLAGVNKPVFEPEEQIDEYGNATDPNNQSTNANQQATSPSSAQTNTQTQTNAPVNSDPAQVQQAAQAASQQIQTVLRTPAQPNIVANAMTKAEKGQQLTPQELDAMGKVNQLVGQADKNPGLRNVLQQKGVLQQVGNTLGK